MPSPVKASKLEIVFLSFSLTANLIPVYRSFVGGLAATNCSPGRSAAKAAELAKKIAVTRAATNFDLRITAPPQN